MNTLILLSRITQAMFWNNTAHSGLIGLVVLGVAGDCTSIGGFTATHHWDYSIFSSTSSSLVVTHFRIAVGKVGTSLNVFGPDPINHLLGRKSIAMYNSLIVGSLSGQTCLTSSPSYVIPSVSFGSNEDTLGVMMSCFNKRRSKMDGTGRWHLSELTSLSGYSCCNHCLAVKHYPVIDGVSTAANITFARFMETGCGYRTVAIGSNKLSPDATHPFHLTGTRKINVNNNSLALFYDPDPAWIVQEVSNYYSSSSFLIFYPHPHSISTLQDCVDMDCDGPKHCLIKDQDGLFMGSAPNEGSIVPLAELR